MQLNTQVDGSIATITIGGDVNIASAPELRKAIEKNVKKGMDHILLVLSDVRYMDSSGVGVLVTGMKLAKSKKIGFSLAEVPERVYSVFELTRLTAIFTIHKTAADALAEARG